jgi:hypothetical protein
MYVESTSETGVMIPFSVLEPMLFKCVAEPKDLQNSRLISPANKMHTLQQEHTRGSAKENDHDDATLHHDNGLQ